MGLEANPAQPFLKKCIGSIQRKTTALKGLRVFLQSSPLVMRHAPEVGVLELPLPNG